jgi:hypothetical protein
MSENLRHIDNQANLGNNHILIHSAISPALLTSQFNAVTHILLNRFINRHCHLDKIKPFMSSFKRDLTLAATRQPYDRLSS